MNNIKLAEETLGQRIKAQRIRVGYTQEQLAEIMCVPKSTISAYENDKVDVKSSIIVELSKWLDTTPNYLLGFCKKENSIAERVAEILNGIKDENVKEMLIAQMKVATQFA